MKWIHQYQLFLFDFDGLLVDTENLHLQAYKDVCRSRGFNLDWDFEQFCRIAHAKASGTRDALYEMFPGLAVQEPRWEILYQEKKDAYENLLRSGNLQLMPGAEELIAALHAANIKRCVVTNSPLKQIEIIREALPVLQTIPLWLTRESYQNPKPAPDGYLKAIEMIGQKGDRVIGFEDSLKGLQSLYAAGADGVLICPKGASHVSECAKLNAVHFESLSSVEFG
ncbi:MAG: HAD family hydrolase [Parachlamydiales bacterium]